eukprot:TRINITY_DN9927_c0_g1_i1.p1 TRINITY_DN9927_c0_g1~~TRINITY_DN9927_c0_g1_i1.p1  ORF type:complete len:645 (-),score=100.90 TRINITY_DN9927_c0_g1_i1:542-2446(-)
MCDTNCSLLRAPLCEIPLGSVCQQSCVSGMCMNEVGVCDRAGLGLYSDYTSSSSGSTTCQSCPGGYYSSVFGSTVCDQCANGQYSEIGWSICNNCALGSFNPDYGQSSCESCPVGITNALPGSTTADDCSTCAAGYFKANSSTLSCIECGFGLFNPSIGALSNASCLPCQPGKYGEGASVSTCLDCPFGTFNAISGSFFSSSCTPCSNLSGVVCQSGSSIPFVGKGLFRSLDNPGVVYQCIPSEACPEARNGSTICSSEYTGFICSECNSEYFRNGGKCTKCIPKAARWFIIVLSILLFATLMGKISDKQQNIPSGLKLLLFWIQFLSLFPALSQSWPKVLSSLLNFTSVFNLDIGYFGMGCDLKSASYLILLAIKIVLPVFFVLFTIFQAFIMKRLGKGQEISLLKVFSSAVFVANFFSIQLFSSMFQVFNCTNAKSDGNLVVAQEPSVVCFGSAWRSFVVFDGIFITFYLLIVPVFITYQFHLAVKNGNERVLRLLIKPLVQAYRPGCEWYEMARLGFKLVFVLIRDVLQMSSATKMAFLCFIILVSLWIESRLRPFESKQVNDLSLMWSIVCQSILVGNFVFSSATISDQEKNSFGIVLVSFLCTALFVSCVQSATEAFYAARWLSCASSF